MKGVRLAGVNDVKAMSYVHARTWKEAYDKFIPREYLSNISDDGWIPLFTRAFVYNVHEAAVYEMDDLITGTITYGKDRSDAGCDDCDEGEIISLYVLPEHWSTMQGFELTKFAVERLKIQGCKSCYLWVIKENERAVNFYRRFGFINTMEVNTVFYAGQGVVVEKYAMNLI
ncbi:acetyltransferase (GNAT) family protein [Ruminiclostridium sufflavum DSM 19573]|uniref:Acetyltransferase (GNAT) family protein n=1 Tax=Ruminiclostridium sufflavum DSM 19573 TaxID=1121337 RepID=A0A318XLX3_9FIRM|nr:GNAT family N-acetyltransferase [Ruminiclostridium sufflavum]PYG87548.1 acetyltransferase (GNAT) family protein [Ruminiclostridium sufflavum DSM 19573]